ncbi:MAG TPA: hypothetical protein VNQ73_07360 [Ilumatobacter sp.]|nr:hypothetical protein [Ilumatobacter sp.]
MSWTGKPTAGRMRLRVAVAAVTLAPALLVLSAVPTPVAEASSSGVGITVTVNGEDARAPAAAAVPYDGVLDVAVGLTNTLVVDASVTVAAGWTAACNVTLTPGATHTCTGLQFAPTEAGPIVTRQALVTTRAERDALGLPALTALAYGEHHGCSLDTGGAAWCWGINTNGRLGDGTTTNQAAAVAVTGEHQFTTITAGQRHTCALDLTGKAWCWGYGGDGQVGNGAALGTNATPVAVSGTRTFSAIAAGDAHTCAVVAAPEAGKVYCWGQRSQWQLGTTSVPPSNNSYWDVPVAATPTPSSLTFAAVAAGGSTTCAIAAGAEAGKLFCWGAGSAGQIGHGLKPASALPTPIAPALTFVAVDVGSTHTCAIDDSAAAWCWGANGSGQLGTGTTTESTTPALVDGDGTYASISAGHRYTCAISTGDDALWCWGESDGARLGSPVADQLTPQPGPAGAWAGVATTGSGGTAGTPPVAAGTTCGRTTDDHVQCWGVAVHGQTGAGPAAEALAMTTTPLPQAGTVTEPVTFQLDVGDAPAVSVTATVDGAPADVPPGPWAQSGATITKGYVVTNTGATAVTGIAVSDPAAAVCPGGALAPSESMTCTATATMSTPEAAYTATATATARAAIPAAAIAAGGTHSCVTTAAGVAWCWGANAKGQLGDGTIVGATAAQHVASFDAYSAISAGTAHTCALHGSDIWCWGQGNSGQLGNGTADSLVPTQVTSGAAFTSVSAGGSTSCGLVGGGGVRCWGLGTNGQRGDNTLNNSAAPVSVAGGPYTSVDVGATHTCVLDADQALYCFGANGSGQLGTGNIATQMAPITPVVGGHEFTAVTAGTDFTCALAVGGAAWCWGTGTNGQLGNGTSVTSYAPAAVAGGHTFSAISAGAGSVCAVGGGTVAGQLWCWGAATGTNTPVRIGTGNDWAAVALGSAHRCARDADGGVACWGTNTSGQVGDGTTTSRATPRAAFLPRAATATATGDLYARWQPSRWVTVTRTVNGSPAAAAPGNQVPPGPLTLGYTFTNTGALPLTNPAVSEPGVALTCPAIPPVLTTTGPTASFTCTASVPPLAGGSTWASTVTVTADWDDAGYSGLTGQLSADATAQAWTTATPNLSIAASANGAPASTGAGAEVPALAAVSLEYVVTNTSPVTVTGLSLIGAGTSPACPATTLAAGASTTCTAATTGPAAGTTTTLNPVAHASWTRPDAIVVAVNSSGVAKLWADATPSVVVTSVTLGSPPAPDASTHPGASFPRGVDVPVTISASNNGPVAVGITAGVAGVAVDGLTCAPAAIEPGSSATCAGTISDVYLPAATQVTATVTAGWTNPGGTLRTATASGSAWLYTEPAPALELQSRIQPLPSSATDAAPGAPIAADDPFVVTYTVTNTGDVPVTGITVVNGATSVGCDRPSLDVGEHTLCVSLTEFPGVAPGATFVNTADAEARWHHPVTSAESTVGTADTVYAWGAATPSLELDARIGVTAYPIAPGAKFAPSAPIPVQLTVTNTGPVALAGLAATLGYGTIECPATVAPGASVTCTAAIPAPAHGGLVTFTPTVSATWTDPAGTTHPVGDTAALFAWVDIVPTVSLATRISGVDADTAPGIELATGTPVAMTYLVTNTAGVPLAGVTVSDPGVSVTCPAAALATGATMTCTATRPAPLPGTQLVATASVVATWTAPDGTPRTATASNPAHGWTDATPALAVRSAVGTADSDPAPGPSVTAGTMTLRTVVTNTGPVAVTGIEVADSLAGTLGCPVAALAPGQTMTCTTTTAAPSPGELWSSVGSAHGTWTNAAGTVRPATATDPVHAWRVATPSVSVTTRLGGLGASMPPGLQVEPGATVSVTYTLANTSPVALSTVSLAAADVKGLMCPATVLAAGDAIECSGTYTAPGGGQLAGLRATVTAEWTGPTGEVHAATDDDTAYLWTTGEAGVLAAVRINGHADLGDGVAVLPGVPAMVAVLVFNAGNVALRHVTVETTPAIGLRCPSTELAVDGVMSCTATLNGPADGTTTTLRVRAAAQWLDYASTTLRNVDHTGTARIVGSRAAPDPVITLDPARLFETRRGLATADGRQNGVGRLADGQVVVVNVAGRGGVPADAASAVLNLTATNPSAPGYVTVWPCGPVRPLASSLNYAPGLTVANSIVAKLDRNGDVCMYSLRATELIVDVNGYALVDGLETVSPARLLDTRPNHTTADGTHAGSGVVAAGDSVRVQVAGRGGVPKNATAAVLNVIATETHGAGHVTVYPCGSTPPNASTLNYTTAATVTNAVVAKLDANGGVCVFTRAAAQIVVDVNGYSTAATGVNALVPARLVDTRSGLWTTVDGNQARGGRVPGGTSLRVRVAGRGGVPPGAQTVLLNLSAVGAQAPGYLTAYPCSSVPPSASNVNYDPTRVVANSAIVQLDEHGDLCLFTLADTDVLVDVTGYLTPR